MAEKLKGVSAVIETILMMLPNYVIKNFKEYTYKVKFKIILVNFEVNIKCIYFFYKYL